ncbi:MAG TPA: prolipoprotein diacylglyceryl transferase [Rhizobiales bacterium]|nr:prolipoprotein diacylglyceryl transferase [Hyphomicrobiales bacterium]
MPLFALPFPVIDPVLIAFGPIAIRWYALAYIAGILIGWWYALRLIDNPGLWSRGGAPLTRQHADDFIVWLALGIITGGRLGYVLFYNFDYYAAHIAEALAIWTGGMSFHGGLVGSALVTIIFCRIKKIPLRALMDVACASVPFGLFFGRLANFIKPELWGRVTDMPWGIVFPGGGPEPRHPSQLYEAALEGIALFIILRLFTHHLGALKRPGLTSGVFACGYGATRILVEFFREPDIQIGYLAGGMTMGMVLSVPLILLGLYLILSAHER